MSFYDRIKNNPQFKQVFRSNLQQVKFMPFVLPLVTATAEEEGDPEGKSLLSNFKNIPEGVLAREDLYGYVAIHATEGLNGNDDMYSREEIAAAVESARHIPINWRHEGEAILGHVYDCYLSNLAGEPVNPEDLAADDQLCVATFGVVFNHYFPHIADFIKGTLYEQKVDELEENEELKDVRKHFSERAYVSLEARLEGFDILWNGKRIPASDASDDMLFSLRVFGGPGVYKNDKVIRAVLGITFTAQAITPNPADPDCGILEGVSGCKDKEDGKSEATMADLITLLKEEIMPKKDNAKEPLAAAAENIDAEEVEETSAAETEEQEVAQAEVEPVSEETEEAETDEVEVEPVSAEAEEVLETEQEEEEPSPENDEESPESAEAEAESESEAAILRRRLEEAERKLQERESEDVLAERIVQLKKSFVFSDEEMQAVCSIIKGVDEKSWQEVYSLMRLAGEAALKKQEIETPVAEAEVETPVVTPEVPAESQPEAKAEQAFEKAIERAQKKELVGDFLSQPESRSAFDTCQDAFDKVVDDLVGRYSR